MICRLPGLILLLALLPQSTDRDGLLIRTVRSEREDAKAVRDLLRAGADPDQTVDGEPLLWAAARRGHVNVLRELLERGADVRATVRGTPILLAGLPPGPCRLLLEFGADPRATDGRKRAALHGAAPELVADLIRAGADVNGADADGRTPLQEAAAAGRDAVVQALLEEGAERPDRDSGAGTTVEPAADLFAAIRAAKDGDTLRLKDGEYRGPIQVAGKRVTLIGTRGSVLLGGDQQVVVFVADKGKLAIDGVTIRGANKATIGVAVRGGELRMSRCSVEQIPGTGAYAENGILSVRSCEFRKIKSWGITALSGSTLEARESVFSGCAEGGIVVQKSASLAAAGCRFEAVKTGVGCSEITGPIAVRGCQIEATELGIQAAGQSSILLAGNQVLRSKKGIQVLAGSKSPPVIVGNTLLDNGMGLFVQAGREGDRTSAVLAANTILGAREQAIVLLQSPGAVIARNLVATENIALQLGRGTDAVVDRTFVHARVALHLPESLPAGTRVVRSFLTGAWEPSAGYAEVDELTRRREAALAYTNSGLRYGAAVRETLQSVRSLDARDARAFAAAFRGLADEIRLAGDRADDLARVSFVLRDALGRTERPRFQVFELGAGTVALDEETIRNPSDFADYVRRSNDPVSQHLRGLLSPEIRARFEGPASSSELVSALVQDLNRILRTNTLFKGEAFASADLSVETRGLMMSPRSEPWYLPTFNRHLLDDVYRIWLPRMRGRTVHDRANSGAFVPAGAFWIVPLDYPDLARLVDVSPRQTLEVEAEDDNALWLRSPEWPEPVLFRLKSIARMRQTLAKLRVPDLTPLASLRPGAEPAQVRAALALARKEYPGLKDPTRAPGMSDEAWGALWTHTNGSRLAALRILGAAGDESDIALLLRPPAGNPQVVSHAAAAIALIEARLGILERGALVRALGGNDPAWKIAAAQQLLRHGVSSAADPLLQALRTQPPAESWNEAALLVGDERPEVLAAMRSVLDRALEKNPANGLAIPSHVLMYLLAHGTREDAAKAAARPLGMHQIMDLIPVCRDPLPLLEPMARTRYEEKLIRCSSLWKELSPSREAEVSQAMDRILWKVGWDHADPNLSVRDRQNRAEGWRLRHAWLRTFERPDRELTEVVFTSEMKFPSISWAPWILYTQAEVLDLLAKGALSDEVREQLDFLSPQELAKVAPFPGRELVLASHQVTVRTFSPDFDMIRESVERRPYILRPPAGGRGDGAVSGVLEVRPRFVDGRLRLSMDLHPSVYYHRKGDLISAKSPKSAFAVYKIEETRGQSLLKSVTLRKNGKPVPLEARGRGPDGRLTYDVAASDLAGLSLELELTLFDQDYPLVIDLFAGHTARALRVLSARSAAADAREAWLESARALSAMGRLEDAQDRYRKAAAKDPAASLELVRMWADRGIHPRAIDELRSMADRNPADATLQADLASELYADGRYADAAAACARADSVPGMKALRMICLFLVGDRAEAVRSADGLPEADRQRLLPLLHLAGAADVLPAHHRALPPGTEKTLLGLLLGQGDAAKEVEALATDAEKCRGWCYAGYAQILQKNPAGARQAFGRAVETGRVDQLEYRLSKMELEKIK